VPLRCLESIGGDASLLLQRVHVHRNNKGESNACNGDSLPAAILLLHMLHGGPFFGNFFCDPAAARSYPWPTTTSCDLHRVLLLMARQPQCL